MILFLSVAMLLAGCDKDNAPVAVKLSICLCFCLV